MVLVSSPDIMGNVLNVDFTDFDHQIHISSVIHHFKTVRPSGPHGPARSTAPSDQVDFSRTVRGMD